jgi:hypothetical protein
MRDASRRRLCRLWLSVLAGRPGSAVVGGVGCAAAALVLLGQGETGPGVGFALLSTWCAVGYQISKRCQGLLGRRREGQL